MSDKKVIGIIRRDHELAALPNHEQKLLDK